VITASVCISNPPCRWPSRISNSGATAKILRHNIAQDRGSITDLIQISALETDVKIVLEEMRSDPNVQEFVDMGKQNGHRLVSIRGVNCGPCLAALMPQQRCFLTSAFVNENGELEWSVIAGGRRSLMLWLSAIGRTGFKAHLKRIDGSIGRGHMTARQEHVLRIAFQNGYFDCPRKVSLEELASMVGSGPSATSEVLRRAERRVLEKRYTS
jgi:predicted DNA binding protein